jgi:thiol:disulfide interchange protein DsbC
MSLASRVGMVVVLSMGLAACSGPVPPADPPAETGAVDAPAVTAELGDQSALIDTLTRLVGAPPDALQAAPVPGMIEARWGSNFAYVTPDGQHVIYGDMLNLQTGEGITEASRKRMRVTALSELGEDNMISFLPESPKQVVTVFTDIDCGYCRKMHREMKDYHAAGIGIRYVFYPRSGPGTESFRKAEAVWCAEDRAATLTQAKDGAAISGPSDCANPILREFQLGQEIGLRGTPMIVLPDGEVVNGYVPAAALAAQFSQKAAKAGG